MRTILSPEIVRTKAPSVFQDAPKQSVSDRYKFIPTTEVVRTLAEAGWYPVEAKEARCNKAERFGFQRHMLKFSQDNSALNLVGDTSIEIVMTNSHDGTSAFQFHAGVFRKVCANGLIVCDASFAELRVLHKGYDAVNILNIVAKISEQTDNIQERIALMAGKQLSNEERIEFSTKALVSRYGSIESAPLRPEAIQMKRRFQDSGADLWSHFNVVQENLIRGGIRGRSADNRRHTSRAVKAIDVDVKLNKELWHIAESYLK